MKDTSNYINHWDEKFSSRAWGRYPPEDLIRFFGRNFTRKNNSEIEVLEIGCGPGANLWFLHREGYKVSGIDGSSAAIEIASKRLKEENAAINSSPADLKVGNFQHLPWKDQSFDVVIDIFSLYANKLSVIEATLNEVHRVLKPQGRLFSKLWGTKCTGFGEGLKIEEGTFDDIPAGPCMGMGLSHFVTREEIKSLFHQFSIDFVDTIHRTDEVKSMFIEEFHCQLTKK